MSAKHYCDKCKKEISGTDIFYIYIEINSPIFFKKKTGGREYCENCLIELNKFVTPYITDAEIERTRNSFESLRSALQDKNFKREFKRIL